MAIALVNTFHAEATTGASDLTMNFTGLAENDYVVVAALYCDSIAMPSPAGWTRTQVYSGNLGVMGVYRKRQSSSPDASFVLTGHGNANAAQLLAAMQFSGVDTSTAEDATLVAAAGATTGAPNSDSITTVTDNAVVISIGGSVYASASDASVTAPTGYGSLLQTNADGASRQGTLAMAIKTVAVAGAENPAAFTDWDTGQWEAATLALRPAPAVGQPAVKRIGGVQYAFNKSGILVPSRSQW